ncbi:hypothetical protein Hanom_Chr10g00933561 [Helianthus anomalus]
MVLVLYLKKALKITAAIKELEESPIERKEMEWRTITNGVDCGGESLQWKHMETYKGKTLWISGFVKEDEVNNRQNTGILVRLFYPSTIWSVKE